MISKLKDKIVRFCRWVWQECKDVKTFLLLMLVIAVVYSPVWVGYLLHALFDWNWALVMASACLLFWAGPFTPFFPLCIAITLSIKRLTERFSNKKGAPPAQKPKKRSHRRYSLSRLLRGRVTAMRRSYTRRNKKRA